ncbi:hypothetical protein [Vibrio caribbeanicus]|uniref:hypothetical protein n=1 Tax=Vibrio caribbeanicus TaxID=701175 RepID=UPI0030DABC39
MKIGNDACKIRQRTLWERATAPTSSSNNLVVDYFASSLNSTLGYRSESCILKSLGYNFIFSRMYMVGIINN